MRKSFIISLFLTLSLFTNCKKDEPMELRCWKFSYQYCLYEAATDTKISCGQVMEQKATAYTKEEVLQDLPKREYIDNETRYKECEVLEIKDYNISEC